MTRLLRVLLVEDVEADALLIVESLREGGFEPSFRRVETSEGLGKALDEGPWDIVLSDYSMPHFDGISALVLIQGRHLNLPCLLLSGGPDEELAVRGLKAGARDFIPKSQLFRLCTVVERELLLDNAVGGGRSVPPA